MHNLFVYTFYRFKDLKNLDKTKIVFEKFLNKTKIRGTILIADEGINGSLSGSKKDLDSFVKFIKSHLRIRKLEIKINKVDFIPFHRTKVRLKKEIVTLGQGKINVNKNAGQLIDPKDWNQIILNKDIRLLDVRNDFEIDIGKFQRSERPKTKSFRELPKVLKNLGLRKNEQIAMYCTGGIRCEKASAFLKKRGFKKVMQLNGGVINYLEYVKKNKIMSYWKGECFVFDNRVTVNKNLNIGRYQQCHGCRHPITKTDMKLKSYKKGVSCRYCFSHRNADQKKRSETRQKQIDHAEKNKKKHPFKKIYAS